jgi:hypothetical protein
MKRLSYVADDRLALLGLVVILLSAFLWAYYSYIVGSVVFAIGVLLMLPMLMAIFGLSE